MRIPFTKMQGAGNDFVVLDETQGRLGLTPAHYRLLADRIIYGTLGEVLAQAGHPLPTPDEEA